MRQARRRRDEMCKNLDIKRPLSPDPIECMMPEAAKKRDSRVRIALSFCAEDQEGRGNGA